MTRSIAGRLLERAVGLADVLHLRRPISGVVHRLPPSLRLLLTRLQVRTGYMHGLVFVPEGDLQRSFEAALRMLGEDATPTPGSYLEFGVFVGTTMGCMYRAARNVEANHLRLVGFDSFQGMPAGVGQERGRPHVKKGQLNSDVKLTRRNLTRLAVPLARIELVAGWFDETLTDETRRRLALNRATVVMVDCVLSSSARPALQFCAPLISDGTIIYFDDWTVGNMGDHEIGERAAFDEWQAAHPELKVTEQPSLRYNNDSRVFLVTRMSDQATG